MDGGLRDKIEAITLKKTKFEIEEILSEKKIPCGSVCTAREAMDSQQLKHRQMVIAVPDPVVGQVKMPGIVAKLGDYARQRIKSCAFVGRRYRRCSLRYGRI